MWDYGMMGYGGWMFVWGLGGLVIFGTLIYIAVRAGTHYARRDHYGYHDCTGTHDGRYYDRNGRYRDDGDCYRGNERRER